MTDSSATTPTPTAQELSEAVAILHRLEPGYLPQALFMEVTRLSAMPIVELVPVRRTAGKTEVLLLLRPADDPTWPNQLHTPGTVVRSTDVSDGFATPLARLYGGEMDIKPPVQPVFVDTILHRQARGTEFAAILYIDLTGVSTPAGTWYPADSLPDNTVETQRGFIALAIQSFEKNQSGSTKDHAATKQ